MTGFPVLMFLIVISVADSSSAEIHAGALNEPADPLVEKHTSETRAPSSSPLSFSMLPVRALFYLYQHGVSPTNGTSCPMYPSCSEYGKLAIANHGIIKGALMTADRLHRCGHDLGFYAVLWDNSGRTRHDDQPH